MAGQTALLVIDVQQGIFERGSPVYQAEEMLAAINRLVEKAHVAGAPVIYIQHNNDKFLIRDSRAWHFHPEIKPQAGDLHIYKQHGNAFIETGLETRLREMGVARIVNCGLVTQGCVRATCLGGLDHEFEVVLASDAHSTYSKTAKNIIKRWHKDLGKAGVTLLASEEISF